MIAALRAARSLERGFGFSCVAGAAPAAAVLFAWTGFVFCASFSVIATSGCAIATCCSGIDGGLVSWGCGMPLPIDVSGVPLLRGGGGA